MSNRASASSRDESAVRPGIRIPAVFSRCASVGAPPGCATGGTLCVCVCKNIYVYTYTQIRQGKTYVRMCIHTNTYARTWISLRFRTYVLIWPRTSIGKLHPKTRRYHRVINYRYGDDQPLIRITIIPIDSFVRALQTYLKHKKRKARLAHCYICGN